MYISSDRQIENVDNYFRLRFGGIGKHLCNHIRVKAHAIGVSVVALLLIASLIFAEISETRIKADASSYVCLIYVLPVHGRRGVNGCKLSVYLLI